jgi:hypothetical protein
MHAKLSRSRCNQVLWLTTLGLAPCLTLGASSAAHQAGVNLVSVQPLPQGKRIILTIPEPELTSVRAPDGKMYTQVELKSTGAQNE